VLKLWELSPSPNNLKVRLALRFKGIPFEAIPVDPADRSGVLAISGQELTPVIEDRGIVLNDSEAILHYLEANYRDAPRLFPSTGPGRRACDTLKERLDRELGSPWLPVFLHGIGRRPELDASARAAFAAALGQIEAEMGHDAAFRPEMPIGDLRLATWAVYALPGPGLVERVPLFRRFRELFAMQEERVPRLATFLAPWNQRLA
jgi:glutathione S-transferase